MAGAGGYALAFRRALPTWAGHILTGLGTGLAYLILPALGPAGLEADEVSLLLGIINGLTLGVLLRLPARWTTSGAVGVTLGLLGFAALAGDFELDNIVIAVVVGSQIWVMCALVRRTGGWRLADARDLIAYVLPVLLVSAVAGALAVSLTAVIDGDSLDTVVSTWQSWVIDDVFGVVVITPAVLTLTWPRNIQWRLALEWSLATAFSLLMTWQIFIAAVPGAHGVFQWPIFVTLGSIWIAVRMGLRAVAPVLAVQYYIGAIATITGNGVIPAGGSSDTDRLLEYEVLAIVFALLTQALGVLRDGRLAAQAELVDSQRLLSDVLDGSPSIVYAKSFEDSPDAGRYVLANTAWEEFTGLTADETIGRTDRELFPGYDAAPYEEVDRQIVASGVEVAAEDALVGVGGVRSFHSARFPLRRADGRVWGVGGIATDITELVQSRHRQQRQAALLRAVFEFSPIPAVRVMPTDGGHREQVFANDAFRRWLGCPGGVECPRGLLGHVHPDDREVIGQLLEQEERDEGLGADQPTPGVQVRMLAHDDRALSAVVSAAGVGVGPGIHEVVVQVEDITARLAAESALREQATRDSVTGLPNRRALRERMQAAIARLRRHPSTLAVLFCDLDRFKDVNDSLGHQVGDRLLVGVADRLRATVRPEDTVARLGGDEFVVLAEDLQDERSAVLLALRLQDRLREPMAVADREFRPAMSIGIATTRDAAVGVDELLRRADLAMYRAKEGGRNRVELYERTIDQQVQFAVEIQEELRYAIDLDRLVMAYQPIVDLASGALVGAESLIRLPAPDGSLRPPSDFVPQAESTGLIIPLGAWIVRRVLTDVPWLLDDRPEAFVSVNVSPVQLRDGGFADLLLDEAAARGVPTSRLAIEVTETALIHDPDRSRRELTQLHDAGVRVALDDFGTGYSSLTWLTQFPVDIVKIDREFTGGVGIDDRKTAVVDAMISVSHTLGFVVVAEGVETPEQRQRLIELGCDRGQGYLFARPQVLERESGILTLET